MDLSTILQILNVLPVGVVWFTLKWLIAPAYALWIFYLAVMCLKRARDAKNLAGLTLYVAYPVLIIGYALDFFVTMTLGTIMFVDLPRETTLTSRLKRYAEHPGTWRFTLAIRVAYHLLDRFDPAGYHVLDIASASPEARDAVIEALGGTLAT